jgi:coenzyme F420-reducing hydrogenase delta subunit
MVHPANPDMLVYLCKNSLPDGAKLPSQWSEAGVYIQTKIIPCSGKIDAQYMLHALEGGVQGVCIITCPAGECTLSQGNYRARIRVRTVQRLLSEIGDDPKRAEIIECPQEATMEVITGIISGAAKRLSGVAA